MSTTFYDSRKNTMKRAITGAVQMAAPSTLAYNGSIKVTNLIVPHGLPVPAGKAPVFRYSYEPFKDGVIWPSLNARTDFNAANPTNPVITGPGLTAWADETNLYLQLFSNAIFADFTGLFNVYYVVYRDFYL